MVSKNVLKENCETQIPKTLFK